MTDYTVISRLITIVQDKSGILTQPEGIFGVAWGQPLHFF